MKRFRPVGSVNLINCSALVLVGMQVASGAGFFLPNQSTEATARGNAWLASADSAAAVHYNPAGLVQLGAPSVEMGVYTIHLGNEATIGGQTYEAVGKWQPVPHLYYAHPFNEDLTFGIGMNSPFGLGIEWEDETPFRQVTTNAEVVNIRASAVLGYRINDELSLGGGVALNYMEGTLSQGLTPFNPLAPTNDFVEFNGDDLAFSWILGVLWQPHEQHSFGAVYRSQADYDLEGRLRGSSGSLGDASLSLVTPESVAVGYAYKPTERWTFEVNVEWINWDKLKSLTIKTPSANLPTQRFDWESTFVYAVGLTYKINEKYDVSIGYDYNEGAQPDLFYNPAVADADRHWLNAGVNYHGEKIEWQFAYQYGFSENRVTGSTIGTDGKYEAEHHSILVSCRYDF